MSEVAVEGQQTNTTELAPEPLPPREAKPELRELRDLQRQPDTQGPGKLMEEVLHALKRIPSLLEKAHNMYTIVTHGGAAAGKRLEKKQAAQKAITQDSKASK